MHKVSALVLFCVLGVVSARMPALAAASDPALDRAVAEHDTAAVIARMASLASEDPTLALNAIPAAYAAMERTAEGDFYFGDRYRIFTSAVVSLASLRGEHHAKAFKKAFQAATPWQARFVLLHAALQNRSVDPVELALSALSAEEPQLVALAARALGNSAEVQVLDPLVEAMLRWESNDVRERATKGRKAVTATGLGGIAWVACRDALEQLTGESLASAIDYRGYIQAHRGKIDPRRPREKPAGERRTGLGLFGMDITGKRIAFVLDISGSMEATDPFTPEQLERLRRGNTGVIGDDRLEKELLAQRKRILRAKRELTAVVEALAEDRRFNIVAYSSKVVPWQDVMVTASEEQKKEAVRFIESLQAQGVTVTDDALQLALRDPLVDTIYLITDGAPTHIGSDKPGLPEDSRQLMQQILNDTRAANYLRQVRIFTLGFDGAEIEFLQHLAAQNHGRYQAIE